MNAGFVNCDSAVTGIFNVTVEVIGIGEVEMSNGNFVGNNSPFSDQRFGGISLPFKVVSGTFDHWEIISNNNYVFDPNVDTLSIELQGDVIVRAYFGESRNIVFDIDPPTTTTSVNINGNLVNTFPYSSSFLLAQNVTLTPIIDPQYGFNSWSSDSNLLSPNLSTEIINFDVEYSDTIKLQLYKKPTIVYDIVPSGTSTAVVINGVNVVNFPFSETVFIDDLNTLAPNIDPEYSSATWSCNYNNLLNGNSMNNSFYGVSDDTLILTLSKVTAFIAGNDTICENVTNSANVSVSFTGNSPFTFSYAIDGVVQPPYLNFY